MAAVVGIGLGLVVAMGKALCGRQYCMCCWCIGGGAGEVTCECGCRADPRDKMASGVMFGS